MEKLKQFKILKKIICDNSIPWMNIPFAKSNIKTGTYRDTYLSK